MPEFHSALQQLLSVLFGRRTGHAALGAVVPKNDDLRFPFREHELVQTPHLSRHS